MMESGNDLWQELSNLADAFGDLGREMLSASRRLHSPGVLPPVSIDRQLADLRGTFDGLRDRSRRLAISLGLSAPAEADLSNLKALAALLDAVGEAEGRIAEQTELVNRALGVLDRALRLEHTSDPGFAPLVDCLEQARALRRSIADGPFEAVADRVTSLAGSDHPFGHLVTMVEGNREVSDALWETLFESVGNAFGRTLAAAVVRGKIVEREAPPESPVEVTPSAEDSPDPGDAPGSVTLIWGESGPTRWSPSPAEVDLYDAALAPDELLNSVASESYPFLTRRVDDPCAFPTAPRPHAAADWGRRYPSLAAERTARHAPGLSS